MFSNNCCIIQITLSFPLSYFVYTFFGGLKFFPFLNFIGVFVIFALGADHVFVAVDKWKNARLKYGNRASMGWTLGFLESICFAILIGVSVDFVIHFSHAYASIPGYVNRSERTKFALIHMGPSILAAAFTSLAGATIMLFTVITFFQKFAIVLFLTIVESTIGSFVFFLTLTDCIGPSNPTYAVDYIVNMISNKRNQEKENNSNNQHDATIITTEKNNDDSSEKLSD